ncbi:hypothetical protein BDZ89DRAFT_1061790 [Hymenopellis radicata]|nr:hypothetical protein BDZ89DRAFT_1061790 [Hymenopellis radicata]
MYSSILALYVLLVANSAIAASIPRRIDMMEARTNGNATTGNGGNAYGGASSRTGDDNSLIKILSDNGGPGGDASSGNARAGASGSDCAQCDAAAHRQGDIINILPIGILNGQSNVDDSP